MSVPSCKRAPFAALCLLCTSLYLAAQTSLGTSSVSGEVQDASGLVVPAASVELTDLERGVSRKIATNESGNYAFTGVAPGLYTLKASKPGFETFTYSNFQVLVSQSATVNITLKVGSVAETVMVNAAGESPLLETSSNALGTVVDRERVDMLPLNGRNFLQLAAIAGGAATPQGNSNRVASQYQHESRSISIGGNMEAETSYLINGISTRGSRLGESALNLSVAAIDQFKMQMSFFMPDQGPEPGIVNVVTKAGTNDWHGQAFEYLRNKIFDARNFYAPLPEPLERNQFGFALGGPILIPRLVQGKDKLWFFANYEGERQIQKFSQRAFTPTAAMFAGDFGEVPQPIYNPFSFDSSTGSRQIFANNVIPPSLINPVSKKLLAYYRPGSSYSMRPSNLFANPANRTTDDQFNARVDVTLSPRQALFGSLMWESAPVVQAGIMPLAGASYPVHTQVAAVQHTFIFRPSLVNIARIGFSRSFAFSQGEGESGGPILDSIGIAGTLDNHGITGISLQGFSGFGRSSGPLGDADNNYQIDEGLNYIRGNHNFQFGSGIRYHRSKQQNANANALGSLSFQTVFSAQLQRNAAGQLAPQPNTGNSFADFLLGLPTSGQVVGLNPFYYRYTQYFPYFQDSWRVKRSLTLNYGLSWYYSSIPDPQGAGRQVPHAFDFQTGLLKYAALGQIDPKVIRPDRNDFTPRFGFAWQPSFLKNTVIRSGVGVYYGEPALIEAQFSMVAPPFQNTVSFLNDQFDPNPFWVLGRNVFPIVPLPPLTKDFAANLPAGFTPFAWSEDSRTPYVVQWNLSVQHTIGPTNSIDLSYMASSAHKQQNRYDIDQCRVTAQLRCDPATRPYPRYNYVLFADNNGNSSYQALVAKYQHQFSHGLALLADYTFSKTITDGWEGGGSTQSQIATCRRCDRGPVDLNVPHRVIISPLYQLPFGHARRFASNAPRALDRIIGGWNVNGILTFATGNSITVTAPNRSGSNFTSVRANRLCDGRDERFSGDLRNNGGQFFDSTCFASPPSGFFGNSGRGVLVGPGTNNWDAGVEKIFPIYERARLLLRGEFFNAWNHTQFLNPAANTGDINLGRVVSARAPRLIQLSAKVSW